jgi:hypothetical protein
MRILRTLLITTLLFTLLVVPAQAQGGVTGYVPLLRQINPGIPLYTQARQAFDRLAPDLLAARRQGRLLDFQPDFSAGLLMVKYLPGADLASALPGLEPPVSIHVAIASLARLEPARPAPKTAAFDPHFNLTLGSSCLKMVNLGDSTRVVGSLRDKTGRQLAVLEGTADATGYLRDCFDSSGAFNAVMPGYKATFKLYDTTGVLLGSYIGTAPAISFTSFDKTNAVLSGKGPALKAFSAKWSHLLLTDTSGSVQEVTKTGAIPKTGAWTVDFGATKFRGGDSFYFTVTASAAFTFERWFTIPYFYCKMGSNYCGLYGLPLQTATLTMTHAGIPYTFSGKFNYSGWFGGEAYDSTGLPVFTVAGDKISGTGLTAFLLPAMTSALDYNTDTVSGKIPANKYFMVWVKSALNSTWYGKWVHSNGTGLYTADFSAILDLDATHAYNSDLYYINPLTGNTIDMFATHGP